MEIRRAGGAVAEAKTELLAVPLAAGEAQSRELAAFDRATGGRLLTELRKRVADPAKRGSAFVYQTHGTLPAELIAVIGIGPRAPFDLDAWRRFAGQAVELGRSERAREITLSVASLPNPERALRAAAAAVEGALLAAYRFDPYKSTRKAGGPERCVILGAPLSAVAASAEARARAIAEATCFARDLINQPADVVTPAHLGEVAERLAREHGLGAHVYPPADLERLGMGAILGVGRGSANPPRLIELIYDPLRGGHTKGGRTRRAASRARTGGRAADARGRHVALVGKGITFDSGGLSLKTRQGMEVQKRDMAGGAAVLGAMQAIARIAPAIEVRGYVASAENMPSATAYRPGDVLKTFTGKTVEVLNTDAEGRLVLADALGYASAGPPVRAVKPEWIVDLATLTGAVTTALGRSVAAVMGNDHRLIGRLVQAGRDAGEPIWELPLVEDYVAAMESPVADLKNMGDGTAGVIFGGLFLREFVGGVPWAHLDIAAVAHTDKSLPYTPRGAVGWGVRTLVALVEEAARA